MRIPEVTSMNGPPPALYVCLTVKSPSSHFNEICLDLHPFQ